MRKLWFIIPIVLVCVVVVVTVPLVVVNNRDTATEDPPTEDPPTEDPLTEGPPTEGPPTEDPPTEGPIVDTNVGSIRGLSATGPGGDYTMFLGIPYARVNPSNPFGLSVPHEDFEGIFNAFDDSAMCPQIGLTPAQGTLDCLHLNIHVPNTASSTNRLPVMVWIHGGALITGSGGRSTYDPIFLIAHDVIVVTINYRLGAYGWLCLDIPEIPGNQGLKDQILAMRWVKNNIEAFGGDVDRITLFGESAGAIAADHHLIFSKENLFNNVILQSGTAASQYTLNTTNSNVLLQMAGLLGHPTGDIYDAIDFLAATDPRQIVTISLMVDLDISPCVEKEFENVEGYITSHPAYADVPNARTKPVLIGFNNNEFGVNFLNLDDDPLTVLQDYYVYDQKYVTSAADYVRKFYLGDNDYDEDEEKQRIANFRSDYLILHPTYKRIETFLQNGASSVYHYMFSYEGNRNVYTILWGAPLNGALHADELGYLFDPMELKILFPGPPTPADQLMIDRMTTLWTNFAKHGAPTSPETVDLFPFPWPSITGESKTCFIIDSEIRLQGRVFHDRMAFWDLYHTMFQAITYPTS